MSISPNAGAEVTGIVLAGGQARRMGGEDKGLVRVAGKPMVEHVIARLVPQVSTLIINANRNLEVYAAYGYPVLPDEGGGFCGPLAGIASAMRFARTPLVLAVPCDSPFVPADLCARLHQRLETDGAEISAAHDGERLHPVFALLQTALLPSLQHYLGAEGRKIDRWYGQHRFATVDFSDAPAAFININSPEELRAVERMLGAAAPQNAA